MKNFYETNLNEYGVGITYAWPSKASAADCKDVVAKVGVRNDIGFSSARRCRQTRPSMDAFARSKE